MSMMRGCYKTHKTFVLWDFPENPIAHIYESFLEKHLNKNASICFLCNRNIVIMPKGYKALVTIERAHSNSLSTFKFA